MDQNNSLFKTLITHTRRRVHRPALCGCLSLGARKAARCGVVGLVGGDGAGFAVLSHGVGARGTGQTRVAVAAEGNHVIEGAVHGVGVEVIIDSGKIPE